MQYNIGYTVMQSMKSMSVTALSIIANSAVEGGKIDVYCSVALQRNEAQRTCGMGYLPD